MEMFMCGKFFIYFSSIHISTMTFMVGMAQSGMCHLKQKQKKLPKNDLFALRFGFGCQYIWFGFPNCTTIQLFVE